MRGINKFKEHFFDHRNHFVLIGGAACYLQMDNLGLEFRATKDLDLVLIVEAISKDFIEDFWRFIRLGNYSTLQKSSGKHVFYRFHSPKDANYPHMIELFSNTPFAFTDKEPGDLTPIPSLDDNISSLSAILLDRNYYSLLHSGTEMILDIPVLKSEYIILFKAKAWIELNRRLENGESVDSKSIKKHQNDVLRLSQIVSPLPVIPLPKSVSDDLAMFLDRTAIDNPNILQLGIRGTTSEEIVSMLKKKFNLE